MLTLILALALGAATFVGTYFAFGLIGSILPTVAVLLLAFFFISRSLAKRMQNDMMAAQNEFQKQRIDRGIAMLEGLKKKYGKWQFFAASSLDGQIGSIHYMRQEFDRAKPYLERAFAKHWIAKGMLAVMAFKKRDYVTMDKLFDTATRYSAKQGLLWSTWAFCHWKLGEIDKAIEILNNGQKKLGDSDPNINANLISLKNSKKMKMKGYGEQWYQFHLEMPPQLKEMQNQRVRFARR